MKLSFIIPVYNREKTIGETLDSIVGQIDDNIEIVIVNDGSTDKTESVINQYIKKYEKNISYYKKDNEGVAATRNFGIMHAKGEYIIFVDSDDYIEKNFIEKINVYLNQNYDVIKFKAQCVDENKQLLTKIDGPVFEKVTGEEGFNKLVFLDNLIDSPCVYVFKKEIFIKNTLFFRVGTEHEDFGLIPLILLLAKSMISINFYGYNYVQTNDSITRNNNYKKTIKKFEDALLHYDNMLQFIKKINISKETQRNVKTYYTNAILLKLGTIEKKDRKPYIKQIKKRKMTRNIKPNNLKQLFKRVILEININYYLKLRK